MNKLWLIMKNEFTYTVSRRSFLITLILLPVIAFAVGWFSTMGTRADTAAVQTITGSSDTGKPEGLVDLSGLVQKMPTDLQEQFIVYASKDAAAAAFESGTIDSFYVVQAEYLDSGKVQYYREDFNPLGGLENTGPLTQLLAVNLVPDDPNLVARVNNPVSLEIEYTSEQTVRDPDSGATFFVPYIVTFLFYTVIFGSASLMLNSVSNEKTNRVIEILATSVKPQDLMTGKIIALGGVGLLQAIVWSGAGLLVLQFTGRSMPDVASYALPVSFFIWGLVFFILGFLVYAGLMAAVGALVPSLREASQMTTIMIIPLIIPLMFIQELATNPSGQFSMIMSLFPLTSPVAMMARLAATAVPFWQLALAVLLLVATVAFILRGAAGIFRTQNLLTGKPVNLKVFLRALAGRE
jgi:ABC-2 type transport system permease protein